MHAQTKAGVVVAIAGVMISFFSYCVRGINPSPRALILHALEDDALNISGNPRDESYEGFQTYLTPTTFTQKFSVRRKGPEVLVSIDYGAYGQTVCCRPNGGWRRLAGIVSDRGRWEDDRLRSQIRRYEPERVALDWLRRAADPSSALVDLGPHVLHSGVHTRMIRVVSGPDGPADLYFDQKTGALDAVGYPDQSTVAEARACYVMEFSERRPMRHRSVISRIDAYENGAPFFVQRRTGVDSAEVPESAFERPSMAEPSGTTSTVVSVPFEELGGMPVVQAAVNGGPPLRFLVDTGAAVSTVFSGEARALHLSSGGEQGWMSGWIITTSQGSRLRSLRVGSTDVPDVAVTIRKGKYDSVEMAGCAGSLGYNFLGHFQVTLDYGAHRMTLAPRSRPLPGGPSTEISVESGQPWAIGLGPNGSPRMVLDTGTTRSFLPPATEAEFERLHPRNGVGMYGDDGLGAPPYAVRLPALSVAGQTGPDYPVWFYRKREFAKWGLHNPSGILGASFLRQFRITIDYARQRLQLVPTGRQTGDEWIGPGIALGQRSAEDLPEISSIIPDSPASREQVHVGDSVLSIDGRPTKGLPLWLSRYLLTGSPENAAAVTILHDGVISTSTLRRVDLLPLLR